MSITHNGLVTARVDVAFIARNYLSHKQETDNSCTASSRYFAVSYVRLVECWLIRQRLFPEF